MANGADPDQIASIGAVCSGSMLFASILNSSVMLGNYLQQTTFSDAFFSWRFMGYNILCLLSPGRLIQNATYPKQFMAVSGKYFF